AANQVGAAPACPRALALNASDCRTVSMEFSVAAVFSSRACHLCGGSTAPAAWVADSSCSISGACCFYNCAVNPEYRRLLHASANADLPRAGCAVDSVGDVSTRHQVPRMGTRVRDIWDVARYISLYSPKRRDPKIQ